MWVYVVCIAAFIELIKLPLKLQGACAYFDLYLLIKLKESPVLMTADFYANWGDVFLDQYLFFMLNVAITQEYGAVSVYSWGAIAIW